MRALVTGGAGFIGSHLSDALIGQGHRVICLDDLSTGSLRNIRRLEGEARFEFVQGSILDRATVDRLVSDADHVYHLGAAVGVKLIYGRPVDTIMTNVVGTEIVLSAAARHRRKIFVASTSEVYGKDTREGCGRFRETDDITLGSSIRWCYATAKALDEYLARAYMIEQGLEVVIGRFFNTVGPRQSGAYGMVVPRFVQQVLVGGPITIYGDGRQIRTFTWVADTVHAVIGLMNHPGAIGEIFNIGSEEPVTINELAQLVQHLAGRTVATQYIPYELAYGPGFEDARYRVPDISKLRALLGYRPTRSLDDVLLEVIEYVKRSVERDGTLRAETPGVLPKG
ncbi:MAG TPA: GDP-mannose 4,6-dehydratase [bacterium]|nr:GDP-mannose 4,6-dehydratase [bacterium]